MSTTPLLQDANGPWVSFLGEAIELRSPLVVGWRSRRNEKGGVK